jgi:hypothetical protein
MRSKIHALDIKGDARREFLNVKFNCVQTRYGGYYANFQYFMVVSKLWSSEM